MHVGVLLYQHVIQAHKQNDAVKEYLKPTEFFVEG